MTTLSQDPYASITELSKAFHEKSLKPSHVVAAQLARIESLDPYLGSYQKVYSTKALKAAKSADEAFSKNQRIGPFHGIPFAIKDIYDLDGHVTAFFKLSEATVARFYVCVRPAFHCSHLECTDDRRTGCWQHALAHGGRRWCSPQA